MAARKEIVQGLFKSSIPAKTPETGLIRIKPFASKVFGNAYYTGQFFGEDKKPVPEWNFTGKTLAVPGLGCVLDMTNPEARIIFDIITKSSISGDFVCPAPGEKNVGQRFYIEDVQSNAEAYLKSREVRIEVEGFIKGLKDEELKRFGLLFGLEGSPEVIKTNLYKMADSPQTQLLMNKMIFNPDRIMYELVAVAEKFGDPAKREGLHKTGSGIYMWNEIVLGADEESMITFLKQEKNNNIYQAIKAKYAGAKVK